MRLAAIVGIATCIAAGVAYGGPAEKARADKLFDDGRKYLAAKEYALACTAFEQSQAADPAIGTQLNIALCYETWGKFGSAYRAYVEAERLAKAKSDARAKGAHTKISELTAKVPHLQVTIPAELDPSTVFLFDAKEIERAALTTEMFLDAGTHRLEARVPGQPPKLVTIELADGDHKAIALDVPKPIVVAPPPPPPVPKEVVVRSSGKLYGGVALGVAGVAAIAIGSVVALGARSDYNTAIGNCPMGVCNQRSDFDATQNARSRANEMTFVGAAGVVMVGVGVFLVVTSKHVEHAPVAIAPIISPTGLGLAIGGAL